MSLPRYTLCQSSLIVLLISAILRVWNFIKALSSAEWYLPRSLAASAADSCRMVASRWRCSTPAYKGEASSSSSALTASRVCTSSPSRKDRCFWSSVLRCRTAITWRRRCSTSRPPRSFSKVSISCWCCWASASTFFSRMLACSASRTASFFFLLSSAPSRRARRPSSSRSEALTLPSAAASFAFKASAFSTRPCITSMDLVSSASASTSRCSVRTLASWMSRSCRNRATACCRSSRSALARAPVDSAAALDRRAVSVLSWSSTLRTASSESTSLRRATWDCSSCMRPFCSAICVLSCSCCLASRSRCMRTESSSLPSSTSCSCRALSWSRSACSETLELAPSKRASLPRTATRSSSTECESRCKAEASGRSSCRALTCSSRRFLSRSCGSRAVRRERSSSAAGWTSFSLRGSSSRRKISRRSQRGRWASRDASCDWTSFSFWWLDSKNPGILAISFSMASSKVARSPAPWKPRLQNWQMFLDRDFSRNFSYICLALSVMDTSFRASSICCLTS
mmetsp:Transcript_133953/g.317635  ORF Transcript_133953/g.317635 Transcript_133953/m.317635 type:complete len:514 (+) Transcript_133953:622-2163(+)